ncbi:MAG: glutaredoxin domain-containing protein [Desulfobacterales bacterium]|jgi:glutaredoxin
MAKFQGLLLALVILIASPAICVGDIYKWVDENGVMHYTDTAPSDESEWEQEGTSSHDAQGGPNNPLRNYDPKVVSEILNEIKDDDDSAEEETKRELVVELYTTNLCKYCQKAKAFFSSRGITFIEYNIEEDQVAAERLLSLTESKAVPFAIINGHHIKGYSASAYVKAMNE